MSRGLVEIESEWAARDRELNNVRVDWPELSSAQVSVQKTDANLERPLADRKVTPVQVRGLERPPDRGDHRG